MPRPPRAEVEGGLYHIVARGNDRQDIFHSDDDRRKFLSLLEIQKHKLGFFLYAYCLMSNHFHLLIERQAQPIGRIMLRVLTGYSQYYNRKYRKVGHVFQGRHKAILCQADRYLGELVRYIHLNPVRAKMVRKAELYPWSSQRAYLDMEPAGIVDVDPVLRHFGARRQRATENFAAFVAAGAKQGCREEYYLTGDGSILGTKEFIDATIHRIWEPGRSLDRRPARRLREFDAERFLTAVEFAVGIPREQFCGAGKSARLISAKEAMIVSGGEAGATLSTLARITGLSSATVSKRRDAAVEKMKRDRAFETMVGRIAKHYDAAQQRIEESKA